MGDYESFFVTDGVCVLFFMNNPHHTVHTIMWSIVMWLIGNYTSALILKLTDHDHDYQ